LVADSSDGYWDQLLGEWQARYAGGSGFDNKGTRCDPAGFIDGPAGLLPSLASGRCYAGCCSVGPLVGFWAAQRAMPWLRWAENDGGLLEEFVTTRLVLSSVAVAGPATARFLVAPDPCAAPDRREGPGCRPYKARGAENCSYYRVTWGPQEGHPGRCVGHGGDPLRDGRWGQRSGEVYSVLRLPSLLQGAPWGWFINCSDPQHASFPCAGLGAEAPKLPVSIDLPLAGKVSDDDLSSSRDADAGCKCAAPPCFSNFSRIEHFGFNISFHFHCGGGPCQCGRFVNGEVWVLGPVNVTETQPWGEEHGLEANPVDPRVQGLLSGYSNYDWRRNLALSLPLAVPGNTSLVKVVRRGDPKRCGTSATKVHGCAEVYEVLTVLDRVPVGGGLGVFRPPFATASGEKPLVSFSSLQLWRLPRLEGLGAVSDADLDACSQRWRVPQYDNMHLSGVAVAAAAIPLAALRTAYSPDIESYVCFICLVSECD
jgi:hypothetical protein